MYGITSHIIAAELVAEVLNDLHDLNGTPPHQREFWLIRLLKRQPPICLEPAASEVADRWRDCDRSLAAGEVG